MKTDNLTLLINSCDSYEDCWQQFFKLLKKYWPDIKLPIILNTETKKYIDNDLEIFCPTVQSFDKNVKWGGRLIKTLNYVNTKYVLLLLDDFFITDYVKEDEIFYLVSIMEKNNISNILLNDAPGPNIKTKYDFLFERGAKAEYKFSLQAGLWEKSILQKYIRNHESPWDTEIWATKRAWKTNDKFYCINTSKMKPISYFDTGVIARGKWLKEKIYELSEKENLKIDFSKRGFYLQEKRSLLNRFINKIKKLPDIIRSEYSVIQFGLKN